MAQKVTDLSADEAKELFLRPECYCSINLPIYFDFKDLLSKMSKAIGKLDLDDIVEKSAEDKSPKPLIKDLLVEMTQKIGQSQLQKVILSEDTDYPINAKDFINQLKTQLPSTHLSLKDCSKSKPILPNTFDGVNYILYQNKDSNLAWRKSEIINPALYIILLNTITKPNNWNLLKKHFNKCSYDKRLECCSIPIDTYKIKADTVTNWWETIEQKSIELSLEFNWLAITDITDCYGSVYTHTIAWAIHGKNKCKRNINLPKPQQEQLLGDTIDYTIRQMTYNQTNGLPQFSVLMDFIAEIVLGYADRILLWKIHRAKIKDFKILRYRDDYRIFTKTKEDSVIILRLLSGVLADLNFKLNSQKTFVSQELIIDTIKPDKIYWNATKQEETTLQKHLLIIHKLAKEHSNSGSLIKALTAFLERINPLNHNIQDENSHILVAILTDIAAHNSKTYPIVLTIIAKILSYETPTMREQLYRKVIGKLNPLQNVGLMLIWLQRMMIKEIIANGSPSIPECNNEPLCKIVESKSKSGARLWNCEWLQPKYKSIIDTTPIIIDKEKIEKLPEVPDDNEVKLFVSRY